MICLITSYRSHFKQLESYCNQELNNYLLWHTGMLLYDKIIYTSYILVYVRVYPGNRDSSPATCICGEETTPPRFLKKNRLWQLEKCYFSWYVPWLPSSVHDKEIQAWQRGVIDSYSITNQKSAALFLAGTSNHWKLPARFVFWVTLPWY